MPSSNPWTMIDPLAPQYRNISNNKLFSRLSSLDRLVPSFQLSYFHFSPAKFCCIQLIKFLLFDSRAIFSSRP